MQYSSEIVQISLVRLRLSAICPFRHFFDPQRLTDLVTLAEEGPRCAVNASLEAESGPTKASWFEFWAAGIEVYKMCIQKGMPGSVHGLGKYGTCLKIIGGFSIQTLDLFLKLTRVCRRQQAAIPNHQCRRGPSNIGQWLQVIRPMSHEYNTPFP